MVLCKTKADFYKCIPIYAVGAVLLGCGLPLMITGIAGTFSGADLVGYVGGLCILFGLGFFLLWYMFTIESKDSQFSGLEYDPDLKSIGDIVRKSRAKEKAMEKNSEISGFANLAFENDKSETTQAHVETVADGITNQADIDNSSLEIVNAADDDDKIQRDVNSETGSTVNGQNLQVTT